MKEVRVSLKVKEEAFAKFDRDVKAGVPKRVMDAVKDDIALRKRIAVLQVRLDRERQEKDLAHEELAHVKREIARAELMIEKFKSSLTPEQQVAADNVNDSLRVVIENQREEFKRAIANQRKRNLELEKQRQELVEEEKTLAGFLLTLEKQLQMEMVKLPSLAQLQHRLEVVPGPRRNPQVVGKRQIDDAEMRTVKKAIIQLKSQKAAAQSLMVGSRYT
jgi:hypothetical protein